MRINDRFGVINDLIAENSKSMVVKTFREGDDEAKVTAVKDEKITSQNATKFIKNLKSSTEATNARINKEYERMQRKDGNKSGK